MSTLTVLLVSTSYPSAESPSAGIFVARLARALARTCRVRVVAPAAGSRGCAKPDRGIDVIRARWAPSRVEKWLHGPGGIPAALARRPLAWLLVPIFLPAFAIAVRRASRGVDVIHANWAVCGWLARIARARRSTPVVLTLRGADVSRAQSRQLDRWLLRNVVRRSDAVVCVNHALRDALRPLAGSRRPTVIPNGVDQAFLDLPLPEPVQTRGMRVAAIGSLIPRKGFVLAIEALAKVRSADMNLTIVGDGEERSRLLALATELGLDDRVTLHAPLPPDEIAGFLERIDVLVCPSLSEGRPNVVVEAMAAARAIIASNIPGMEEIIRDNDTGLLFASGSAEALAVCLDRIATSSDLRLSLGRRARQFIRSEGLTWTACGERYLRIYRELAG